MIRAIIAAVAIAGPSRAETAPSIFQICEEVGTLTQDALFDLHNGKTEGEILAAAEFNATIPEATEYAVQSISNIFDDTFYHESKGKDAIYTFAYHAAVADCMGQMLVKQGEGA